MHIQRGFFSEQEDRWMLGDVKRNMDEILKLHALRLQREGKLSEKVIQKYKLGGNGGDNGQGDPLWHVYANLQDPVKFDQFFVELYEDNLRVNGNEKSDFPSYLR